MTEYVSDVKEIAADITSVFTKLSDLSNIEQFKDRIPQNSGIKDIKCDHDTVSFNINPVGEVGLKIVARDEHKTIKLEADKSPVALNIWIQLVDKGNSLTKIRLTLKADIPVMIKMMVDSKLKDGINKIADVLANLKYS